MGALVTFVCVLQYRQPRWLIRVAIYTSIENACFVVIG